MQTKERKLFIDVEIVRHDIRRIKAFSVLRDCKSKCHVGLLLVDVSERHLYLSVEFKRMHVNKNDDARDKKRRKIFKFARNTL